MCFLFSGLENVIFKLEKYLNEKIYADVIKILAFKEIVKRDSPFENESSLMSIGNDGIVDIETMSIKINNSLRNIL